MGSQINNTYIYSNGCYFDLFSHLWRENVGKHGTENSNILLLILF